MKRLTVITGAIVTIGIAIKYMGHLTIENALAYGIVLWVSVWFIKQMWNLTDKKSKKRRVKR